MILKRIFGIFIVVLTVVMLSACGEKGPQLDVTHSELGSLNEDNTLNLGYKFTSDDREFALNLNIENSGEEVQIKTVWQYRVGGGFNEIVSTVRNAKPGASELTFPLQVGRDLYYGEYLAEVYFEEQLIAAHRFWILHDGKETNDGIGIYKLTRCAIKPNNFECAQDELCEPFFFKADGQEDEVFVCEAI